MKRDKVMNIPLIAGLMFTVIAGLRHLWNGILWLGGSFNSIKSAHSRLNKHEKWQDNIEKTLLEIREEIGKIYQFILTLKN